MQSRFNLIVGAAFAAAALTLGDLVLAHSDSDPSDDSRARSNAYWGGKFHSPGVSHGKVDPPQAANNEVEQELLTWHHAALHATGLDHSPVAQGERRLFGEQLGPLRTGRAMAIVHIAIYDALVTHTGGYQSYSALSPSPSGPLSPRAALAQAAHDSLVAMFPSQRETFDQLLARQLTNNRDPLEAVGAGRTLGQRAAAAIIASRAADGSQHAEPRYGIEFVPSREPGRWRQDPVSQMPIAMGAHWSRVRPFVLRHADQFRLPPPPAFESRTFARAYNEVKSLGGDGIQTATSRDYQQTLTGLFWAYDGTPSLCAPPRLYNQFAMAADQRHPRFDSSESIQWRTETMNAYRRAVELARYLALINTAMADVGIAAWDSKYHYQLGRPVTLIREGVANSALSADEKFMPLGAPASNLNGPNFTPPFPAYPSGHAAFGGALFQIIRRLKGDDDISVRFVSDELNGQTRGDGGEVRPLVARYYRDLSAAELENARSRIYLGIHWSFDSTEGIKLGNQVADYVLRNAFLPASRQGRQ